MSLKNILSFIVALIGVVAFVVIIGFITNKAYEPIRGKGPGYTLPEPEVAQIEQAEEEPQENESAPEQQTNEAAQPATQEAAGQETTNQEAATQVATSQEATDEAAPTLASRLANADIEAGEKVAKKCIACHSLKPDLKLMVGPPLYNIVGQPLAHTEGYKYSDIMVELAGQGKVWTFENLDEFIKKPKDFAPKTKMTYSGIKSDEDRANLLLYLRSLSDNPVPLPSE